MAQKFLLILLVGLLVQCKVDSQIYGTIHGEGDVVKKTIQLDDFHGISMSIACDVIVTQGNPQQVTVEAQQNIIDNIERKVEDGNWDIEYTKNVRDAKPVKITITVPTLDEVALSGSGSIVTTNRFTNLKHLDLAVSGSGKLEFAMEAQDADLALSGSGYVMLSGNVNTLDIAISGSGDVNAKELKSKSCDVAISGSGDASVHVDGDLDASISGSGDITYSGNANVESSVIGSGRVSKQ